MSGVATPDNCWNTRISGYSSSGAHRPGEAVEERDEQRLAEGGGGDVEHGVDRSHPIGELTADELAEVVYDAWLARAGKRAREKWLAERGLAE